MKFNKDTFLNAITTKVQSAIDKNLITKEDFDSNNVEHLHNFIKFELLEYIEDRKFAIDVLKDFNYDEKTSWDKLQQQYGTFKSLMDIALVNLWKYLQSEKATEYSYYGQDNRQIDKPMLDFAHDEEEMNNGVTDAGTTLPSDTIPEEPAPVDELPGDSATEEPTDSFEERPRRRIRIARPE